MTENHEEALAWLQKNAPDLKVFDFEPGDCIVNVYKLRTVLEKIHEIRNSIVGLQTVNWSEHIYPLVAALGEIGLNAEGYETSRPRFTTMLERTCAAEKKVKALQELIVEMDSKLWDDLVSEDAPHELVKRWDTAVTAAKAEGGSDEEERTLDRKA
jgi:hypothetical protein